jgi:protein TonB
MKFKHLILVLNAVLLSAGFANGQSSVDSTNSSVKSQTKQSTVFTVVDKMPEFPGGDDSLLKFINMNTTYPDSAKAEGITGRVYVTFVIDESGKVTDAKILRGLGYGCDEEVLRVMSIMPLWSSGMQNGKAVKVQYNLPFVFSLR